MSLQPACFVGIKSGKIDRAWLQENSAFLQLWEKWTYWHMNRMTTELELQVSVLKEELRVKTETLEEAILEIARLTTEAQTNREQSRHAQALRSTTATTSRYWAPAQ
jgi:hypothetical protein